MFHIKRKVSVVDYRTLKHTDVKVSRLCLGTMTFGKPADQTTATRMVNRCIDAGINFVDTANIYQAGLAESMLGEAIRGKRDKLILATKVRGQMGESPDESGLSKRAIFRAIDDSLKRLKVDYVDLYYLHQPDHAVPIEDTLGAIEELVSRGKIRYPGTSNYAAWQICEMLWIAERHGYTPAHVSQPMYNLLARGIEQECLPMAKKYDVSIISYNPLAGGMLTGKHSHAAILPGTRFDKNSMYQERYWHPENFAAVEKLKKVAEQVGRSLISVALSWLLCHTATDCVILGASRVEQLEQNLAACKEGPLPPEVLEVCDEVWAELRNPVPTYNR
jgi:aryl-alcohol dehydrogenase-like predicted oxidoreductase